MDWFGILEVARKLDPRKDGTFTAKDLNKAIRFPDTKECTADQIASAWICKFVKWGYAEKVGTLKNPGHKPLTTYTLTNEGFKVEVKLSDIDQLRDAVRAFETARVDHQSSMGKKTQRQAGENEEQAFVNLIELCNKLDREEFGVD